MASNQLVFSKTNITISKNAHFSAFQLLYEDSLLPIPPEDFTTSNFTLSSNHTNIVSVSGLTITGVANGTAVISATAKGEYSGKTIENTITITVANDSRISILKDGEESVLPISAADAIFTHANTSVEEELQRKASLTVSSVDIGEGEEMTTDLYCVPGSMTIGTNDIADEAITADKIDRESLIDIIYPVGSIYMSATISEPGLISAILGGTWQTWGTGRVPVAVDPSQTEFNTPEKTGGEKTHALIVNEMPAHKHTLNGYGNQGASGSQVWRFGGGGSIKSDDLVGSTGGGQAHNNLQPYITCYFYKRTA